MNRNMRLPSRAVPSVDQERTAKNPNQRSGLQPTKKKPPPRPPPPKFHKIKSKSAWNLDNRLDSGCLIDLSPPDSPKPFLTSSNSRFSGSISSSFSSSSSSLASSKRSFECESVSFEHWALNPVNSAMQTAGSIFYINGGLSSTAASVPTIIRPLENQIMKSKLEMAEKESSHPMPTTTPPSPPKEFEEVPIPYGIALYDYDATHKDDLGFKANEVIFLVRRINSEWLYGRIEDREGLFPNNYISIQVPLPEDDRLVTALYEFIPQTIEDLSLQPGQSVLVTGRISSEWLKGESKGSSGHFPANFVDRIPSTL